MVLGDEADAIYTELTRFEWIQSILTQDVNEYLISMPEAICVLIKQIKKPL